jgi:hypothetical protein
MVPAATNTPRTAMTATAPPVGGNQAMPPFIHVEAL